MIVMKENKDERINKALKLYFNNKEGLKIIGECIFGKSSKLVRQLKNMQK